MRGLIHIYCGDGKGKTTAALGLALRAVGRGKRVVIARFLKNDDSGEIGPLSRLGGVTLIPCRRSFGFTWNMTPEERAEAAAYYGGLLEEAWKLACPKEACGKDFITVTPGVRFAGGDAGDQVRITTPAKAREIGTDLIVVGRPITAAPDPVEAYRRCVREFVG